ncbi:hypothetical protein LVD17_15720 [Fulvivirga ulvae]|uniref:hypothetical protein n=1 Tax=Fulvivirga ulvae TaxID=2904245 RepID=UPI001F3154EE|nr:hypothetical protein [Fulvivirga ulvae]UII29748.1 hypothetical protein LVD17_15720 [Fulvivirga ulvae]
MNQINSIEQLRKTGDLFHAIFAMGKVDYQLSVPDFPPLINQQISQQLNSYKNQCGCTAGSIATGIAILLVFCSYLTGILEFSLSLKQLVVPIIAIALAATLGKAISILHARIQMVILIRSILTFIEHKPGNHYRT